MAREKFSHKDIEIKRQKFFVFLICIITLIQTKQLIGLRLYQRVFISLNINSAGFGFFIQGQLTPRMLFF